MDRQPRRAPFAKGTQVRYVGERRVSTFDANGNEVPVIQPGIEHVIADVRPGRRGTLLPLPGEWDDDDVPLDTTQDGYSVFFVDVPGRKPFGRIIWPENGVPHLLFRDHAGAWSR